MFRTGNRGRLLPDGSLVVDGRINDNTQIKIRSVRVNLQDIKHTIVQAAKGAEHYKGNCYYADNIKLIRYRLKF